MDCKLVARPFVALSVAKAMKGLWGEP